MREKSVKIVSLSRRGAYLLCMLLLLCTVSGMFLFSCAGGVDIGGADKVLTSFIIIWPEGFNRVCFPGTPVSVTINALDQNGDLLSWTGTVAIVTTNTEVLVNPGSADLVAGTAQVSLDFSTASGQNGSTRIRVSFGEIISEMEVTVTVDYQLDVVQPTSAVTPASGSAISGSTQIRVVFSESMDTDSLIITGTMAGKSDLGVWSDGVSENDTLTISPSGLWAEGYGTLNIDCDDLAGNGCDAVELEYTVDLTLPTVQASPSNGTHLDDTGTQVVLSFSESMDPSSLVLGGTLAESGDGGTWSTDTSENDTLTIGPDGQWPAGFLTLTVDCYDIVGNAVATLSLTYYIAVVDGTIYVDGADGDDEAHFGSSWDDAVQTIQKGIDLAAGGMTVLVGDGTYSGEGNKNLDFGGEALHVRSSGGPKSCVINCGGTGRAVWFQTGEGTDSIFEGFTVTGGALGGIRCDYGASPTIRYCIVSDNYSSDEGGYNAGGILLYNSSAVVSTCLIADNECDGDAGGIFVGWGTPHIINCVIANNNHPSSAGNGVGGIYNYEGTVTIDNTIIWGNTGHVNGDQIRNYIGATMNLNNCCYADGAGDVVNEGTLNESACINDNPNFRDPENDDYTLDYPSPCIESGDNELVPGEVVTDLNGDDRFTDGSASGTAVVDMGPYEFNRVRIVPVHHATIQAAIDAVEDGGVVFVQNGTYTGAGNRDIDFGGKPLHLKSTGGAGSCVIDCDGSGRGFHFHSGETLGTAVVDGFTVTNGSVTDAVTFGGGMLFWGGAAKILNCIIEDNTCNTYNPSVGGGGGVALYGAGSTVLFINCLVRENDSLQAGGNGGGFYSYNSSAEIVNCTIAGNFANLAGGGIYIGGTSGTLLVRNSVIWGNTSVNNGYQISAARTCSLYYCDYGNDMGDVDGSVSDLACITDDPLFQSEFSNCSLQGTSPCRDAGNNTYITPYGIDTDLIGNDRFAGGTVDMGAYEYPAD